MRTVTGPLVYHTQDGRKLQRSTQSTVIPDGWTGNTSDIHTHGLYIRRTLRMQFIDMIRESRNELAEICVKLRIKKLNEQLTK